MTRSLRLNARFAGGAMTEVSFLGLVPDENRGSLPFSLIYGEPLIAVSVFALEAAGVQLLDVRTAWETIVATGLPLVLHDPLCPLTPVSFLGEAMETSVARDRVVVGVRAVTDTIKPDRGDRLGPTVDRSILREVVSPIAIPARVVAVLEGWPVGDFAHIASSLMGFGLDDVEAPALARRVRSVEDIPVLEALGRVNGAERDPS